MKRIGVVLLIVLLIGIGVFVKVRWGNTAKLIYLGSVILLWGILWLIGSYIERRRGQG
jgi:hypothetical protein